MIEAPTTTLVEQHNTRSDGPASVTSRWWKIKDGRVHQSIFNVVQQIEARSGPRRMELGQFAALYENTGNGRMTKDGRIPLTWKGGRLSFNVIRAAINTAVAKIAKNRPRVTFLTDDGDWDLQKKAEKLTKFTDGIFQSSKIYEVAPKAFKDGCIFDGGAFRIFVDEHSEKEPVIRCEHAFIDEIIVDEIEAAYGKPRQLHQKRTIARDVLIDMFPDMEEDIKKAPFLKDSELTESDMVEIIESWHLPSGIRATDGRHAITCETCTLLDEEYKKMYFPFVFFRWEEPVNGFWGTGIASELVGIQNEITRILKKIQISIQRNAGGNWVVPKACKIPPEHFTSESGGILICDTTQGEPKLYPGISLPGDVYTHLERLIRYAFELTGVSQSSAAGKKPAGVEAAVAIREVNDIESERFSMQALRYERLFLEAAEIMLDMARDLYEDGNVDLTTKSDADKFIKTIKWSEVDMEADLYQMRMYPTSLLPTQPSARLQKVTELVQAGFLEKQEAMSLLDFPDVKSVTSIHTAAIDDARMVVSHMANGGKYVEPEPFMDLEICGMIAQSEYLRLKTKDNVKEENLQKLRDFMDAIKDLMKPPPQISIPAQGVPAGPQQPGMPAPAVPDQPMPSPEDMAMAAQAAGHAPPVSDIIPKAEVGRRYLSPVTNP